MATQPKITIVDMMNYLKGLQQSLVGFSRTSPHLYKDLVRNIDNKLKELDAELLASTTNDVISQLP